MIATLGTLTILTAFSASIVLAVRGLRAGATGSRSRTRVPVVVLAVAALATFALLEVGILTHDFSIAYVANNTATTTPFIFLLASGWAALEGSIVLWGVVLAVFTFLVWRTVDDADALGSGALGIIGLVSTFWFGLMLTVGNPFSVCVEPAALGCVEQAWWPLSQTVAPALGRGPNPLLQNHILMAIHPPLLYVGYVGFTVPFAFAISSLVRGGSEGATWLDRTHHWSLVAWIFLTAGIVLGGWWSYEVLGWGGYWAWDPVENAALLPWLVGTAFIHSAIVQRRRGMLQSWNFILVIATFALTILGTFLTRSGVIASVHSFTQSSIGPILLVFLAFVVLASLGVFAARSGTIAQAPRLESLVSREGFILLNNLVLTVFTFAVLFGTVYPLVVETATGTEVAVGRSFYDRAAVPMGLLLLLLIGLGSMAPWRVATWSILWRRIRPAIVAGLIVGALSVVVGVDSWSVVLAIGLAGFVVTAIAVRFVSLVAQRPESIGAAMGKVVGNDMSYWGGQVAHIGVALVAISLATTSGLAVREGVTIDRGESALVAGYCLSYDGPFTRSEPNREVSGVVVRVLDASCSDTKAVLEPRLNQYAGTPQPIGTPAVWTGLVDDVYVGIAGGNAESVDLNVFVFPFQWMLWVGGFVIVAGGGMALVRKPLRSRGTSESLTELEGTK